MYGLVVTHSYIQREIIYFALVCFITCTTCCWKIAEDANNSGHILNAQRLGFLKTYARGMRLKKKIPLEKSQRKSTVMKAVGPESRGLEIVVDTPAEFLLSLMGK